MTRHKRSTVAGFLNLGANKSPLAEITHGVDQIRFGNKKGALSRALKIISLRTLRSRR
jgi:hypothetical protein